LKARLSEFLDAVKAGEEVIVTDRGEPVARLARIAPQAQSDARIERLVKLGLVRRPVASLPADIWDWPRPADPAGRALATLIEERREGR
jgi:prevent-host-death family protein